jgi:asparagine synthase (glutamine-hydrolysing)
MIDGQGADEQLAGYGGNDVALYSGLIGAKRYAKGWKEARSYKKKNGKWPLGFLLGAFQVNYPRLIPFFPKRYQLMTQSQVTPKWLKPVNFKKHVFVGTSLRANLMHQVQVLPLPSLLRYEDRNSMAFSVESRVPFMDYRLMEFALGLPEDLIYRKGVRKYILRTAFKGLVPDKILARTDKMGFVSAEEKWLKEQGKDWFLDYALRSAKESSSFLDAEQTGIHITRMQTGNIPFDFDPWRILCLGRWLSSKR